MSTASTIPPLNGRITVGVSAERAFDLFTRSFNTWWPADYHIGQADIAEAIIEPHVGGRWYERGVDGSECEVGKVMVWDPPARLVLAWQLTAEFKYDPALITEVEVQFIAEGANATRVELEHRNLERFGDRADAMRQQIDAPDGWPGILQLFAQSATQA
jgi:hypothetical protein